MEEPYISLMSTTGLHPHDVGRLIKVFDHLVKAGNSVVVIEHQQEVILESHWVIDLGPEGGKEGEEVIAEGSPENMFLSDNMSPAKKKSISYELHNITAYKIFTIYL